MNIKKELFWIGVICIGVASCTQVFPLGFMVTEKRIKRISTSEVIKLGSDCYAKAQINPERLSVIMGAKARNRRAEVSRSGLAAYPLDASFLDKMAIDQFCTELLNKQTVPGIIVSITPGVQAPG